MTVEDLVSTASLGITVLAGAGGLGREVLWAHSCEMEAPEQWLGPHELLMTVGLCVPRRPAEQAAFIGRLEEAGLAGLMIGDHETAPPIAAEMLREAELRDFPVLLAATETPYAVVARHVAAANSSSQILPVLALSKIYQLTAGADDAHRLVAELAALLGVGLRIVDSLSGLPILEGHVPEEGETDRVMRSYPLQTTYPAELVVFEHTGEPVDTFILVHLKKVLEVAVGRVLTAVDHHADRAASALRQILAGGVPPDLEELLGDHLPGDGFHVAAFPAAHGARVARAAAVRRLPALVGPGRADHFALVPRAVVEELRRITEAADIPVGLSSEFTDARDALSAAAEASRVLDSARFGNRLWSEFEGTSISVLARSRREASDIVAGVLGALAEPTPAAEKLRSTLFCYLRNDRHWQATADELGIHRQTLSYRLRRIEEETGMSVTRSGDLSALWIAYQAWEDLGRAAEGETGSRSGPSGPAR